MMKKRRVSTPAAAINITPLIDILLVLLVIFMVITPIDSTGLQAAIPQEPPPGVEPLRNQAIVLSMSPNGSVRINQDDTTLLNLEIQLRELFKTRSDRVVFVQADGDLLFNDVARLIDIATGAGAWRVGLLTSEAVLEQAF